MADLANLFLKGEALFHSTFSHVVSMPGNDRTTQLTPAGIEIVAIATDLGSHLPH
jgi:hypothetical protein